MKKFHARAVYIDKYGCSIETLGLGLRQKYDKFCHFSESELGRFIKDHLEVLLSV